MLLFRGDRGLPLPCLDKREVTGMSPQSQRCLEGGGGRAPGASVSCPPPPSKPRPSPPMAGRRRIFSSARTTQTPTPGPAPVEGQGLAGAGPAPSCEWSWGPRRVDRQTSPGAGGGQLFVAPGCGQGPTPCLLPVRRDHRVPAVTSSLTPGYPSMTPSSSVHGDWLST